MVGHEADRLRGNPRAPTTARNAIWRNPTLALLNHQSEPGGVSYRDRFEAQQKGKGGSGRLLVQILSFSFFLSPLFLDSYRLHS